MTTDAPVDVDVLREEIRKTYTDVSTDQEQEFIFPTGRSWAVDLGYPEPELSRVPDPVVESFAGVANHWILGRADPGAVVLDLGCGAGTDLSIAAQMAGPDGRVIGVDMTAAMLDRARDSGNRQLTSKELRDIRTGFENCRNAIGEDYDLICQCHGEYDLPTSNSAPHVITVTLVPSLSTFARPIGSVYSSSGTSSRNER